MHSFSHLINKILKIKIEKMKSLEEQFATTMEENIKISPTI